MEAHHSMSDIHYSESIIRIYGCEDSSLFRNTNHCIVEVSDASIHCKAGQNSTKDRSHLRDLLRFALT